MSSRAPAGRRTLPHAASTALRKTCAQPPDNSHCDFGQSTCHILLDSKFPVIVTDSSFVYLNSPHSLSVEDLTATSIDRHDPGTRLLVNLSLDEHSFAAVDYSPTPTQHTKTCSYSAAINVTSAAKHLSSIFSCQEAQSFLNLAVLNTTYLQTWRV